MMARGGRSQEIGEALQAQARQIFPGRPRVRDGTRAHPTFASDMGPVRRDMERLREAGQTCGGPKTEGTCREILKLRQGLWTFVRHAGVEPTNNAAEVRSVDQKPSVRLGGLVPGGVGGKACYLENSCWVSVSFRSPLVRG